MPGHCIAEYLSTRTCDNHNVMVTYYWGLFPRCSGSAKAPRALSRRSSRRVRQQQRQRRQYAAHRKRMPAVQRAAERVGGRQPRAAASFQLDKSLRVRSESGAISSGSGHRGPGGGLGSKTRGGREGAWEQDQGRQGREGGVTPSASAQARLRGGALACGLSWPLRIVEHRLIARQVDRS